MENNKGNALTGTGHRQSLFRELPVAERQQEHLLPITLEQAG